MGDANVVTAGSPHPNEVDCKRIERALEQRHRYRYVSPEVTPSGQGYRIKSPCCSRNVDKEGGVIDVAWIEYGAATRSWRLHRKDHAHGTWLLYQEFETLAQLLQQLNMDPERIFWQ
jgi:hypothetical protein